MNNESSSKLFTRGGQISFHNLRMFFQINKAVFKFVLLIMALSIGFLTYYLTPNEILITAFEYNKASILGWFDVFYQTSLPIKGKWMTLSSKVLITHPYFQAKATLLWVSAFKAFLWALVLTFISFIAVTSFFIRRGINQGASKFIRGAKLAPAKQVATTIFKDKAASDIVIDGMPMLKDSEVQHFLIHGTIGTGKSQLMKKFLEQIRRRGDRVILYDKGCSFTTEFFEESKDVILNPFDKRCADWDLWSEAPRDTDLHNMAESLIPLHGQTDPFWVDAARTVFTSVASKLRDDDDRSIDKLLAILLTSEFESLEPFLEGTPAATLVSGKIEKTAISIRSVITTYLKSMQSLKGLDSADRKSFTIRDYILDKSSDGWLFISSNGEQHASLKPLISMWLAMASIALLSLPENKDRRIWFICDELPSLHKLPMLGETIAEVRKFGGCFMLGMQSQAQLGKVYGRDGASEIFDLLNTRFFFRSPSSDMAKLVAKELGDEEIEESTENYSYGANSIRDGISVGKNRTTRPIVMYPEIMSIKDLVCFLRFPGDYPITTLNLEYQERKKIALGFIERDLAGAEKENIAAIPRSGTTEDQSEEKKPLKLVSKSFTREEEKASASQSVLNQQIEQEDEIVQEIEETYL